MDNNKSTPGITLDELTAIILKEMWSLSYANCMSTDGRICAANALLGALNAISARIDQAAAKAAEPANVIETMQANAKEGEAA